MAQAFITRRGGGNNALKTFESILSNISYTGTMLSSLKKMDGDTYALLILETSGTLTVDGSYTGDIWLCGGGGGGGTTGTGATVGAGGGGGGYTTNVFGTNISSGAVVIGAGGGTPDSLSLDGGETSYLSHTAAGGERGYPGGSYANNAGRGGNGGSGGGSVLASGMTQAAAGIGQGTSTRPFLCNELPAYSAGGGGGSTSSTTDGITYYYYNGGDGGSDGGNGTQGNTSAPVVQGKGGEYGGGSGSTSVAADATRYGGGGGGGFTARGNGYPGCVMIRIPV